MKLSEFRFFRYHGEQVVFDDLWHNEDFILTVDPEDVIGLWRQGNKYYMISSVDVIERNAAMLFRLRKAEFMNLWNNSEGWTGDLGGGFTGLAGEGGLDVARQKEAVKPPIRKPKPEAVAPEPVKPPIRKPKPEAVAPEPVKPPIRKPEPEPAPVVDEKPPVKPPIRKPKPEAVAPEPVKPPIRKPKVKAPPKPIVAQEDDEGFTDDDSEGFGEEQTNPNIVYSTVRDLKNADTARYLEAEELAHRYVTLTKLNDALLYNPNPLTLVDVRKTTANLSSVGYDPKVLADAITAYADAVAKHRDTAQLEEYGRAEADKVYAQLEPLERQLLTYAADINFNDLFSAFPDIRDSNFHTQALRNEALYKNPIAFVPKPLMSFKSVHTFNEALFNYAYKGNAYDVSVRKFGATDGSFESRLMAEEPSSGTVVIGQNDGEEMIVLEAEPLTASGLTKSEQMWVDVLKVTDGNKLQETANRAAEALTAGIMRESYTESTTTENELRDAVEDYVNGPQLYREQWLKQAKGYAFLDVPDLVKLFLNRTDDKQAPSEHMPLNGNTDDITNADEAVLDSIPVTITSTEDGGSGTFSQDTVVFNAPKVTAPNTWTGPFVNGASYGEVRKDDPNFASIVDANKDSSVIVIRLRPADYRKFLLSGVPDKVVTNFNTKLDAAAQKSFLESQRNSYNRPYSETINTLRSLDIGGKQNQVIGDAIRSALNGELDSEVRDYSKPTHAKPASSLGFDPIKDVGAFAAYFMDDVFKRGFEEPSAVISNMATCFYPEVMPPAFKAFATKHGRIVSTNLKGNMTVKFPSEFFDVPKRTYAVYTKGLSFYTQMEGGAGHVELLVDTRLDVGMLAKAHLIQGAIGRLAYCAGLDIEYIEDVLRNAYTGDWERNFDYFIETFDSKGSNIMADVYTAVTDYVKSIIAEVRYVNASINDNASDLKATNVAKPEVEVAPTSNTASPSESVGYDFNAVENINTLTMPDLLKASGLQIQVDIRPNIATIYTKESRIDVPYGIDTYKKLRNPKFEVAKYQGNEAELALKYGIPLDQFTPQAISKTQDYLAVLDILGRVTTLPRFVGKGQVWERDDYLPSLERIVADDAGKYVTVKTAGFDYTLDGVYLSKEYPEYVLLVLRGLYNNTITKLHIMNPVSGEALSSAIRNSAHVGSQIKNMAYIDLLKAGKGDLGQSMFALTKVVLSLSEAYNSPTSVSIIERKDGKLSEMKGYMRFNYDFDQAAKYELIASDKRETLIEVPLNFERLLGQSRYSLFYSKQGTDHRVILKVGSTDYEFRTKDDVTELSKRLNEVEALGEIAYSDIMLSDVMSHELENLGSALRAYRLARSMASSASVDVPDLPYEKASYLALDYVTNVSQAGKANLPFLSVSTNKTTNTVSVNAGLNGRIIITELMDVNKRSNYTISQRIASNIEMLLSEKPTAAQVRDKIESRKYTYKYIDYMTDAQNWNNLVLFVSAAAMYKRETGVKSTVVMYLSQGGKIRIIDNAADVLPYTFKAEQQDGEPTSGGDSQAIRDKVTFPTMLANKGYPHGFKLNGNHIEVTFPHKTYSAMLNPDDVTRIVEAQTLQVGEDPNEILVRNGFQADKSVSREVALYAKISEVLTSVMQDYASDYPSHSVDDWALNVDSTPVLDEHDLMYMRTDLLKVGLVKDGTLLAEYRDGRKFYIEVGDKLDAIIAKLNTQLSAARNTFTGDGTWSEIDRITQACANFVNAVNDVLSMYAYDVTSVPYKYFVAYKLPMIELDKNRNDAEPEHALTLDLGNVTDLSEVIMYESQHGVYKLRYRVGGNLHVDTLKPFEYQQLRHLIKNGKRELRNLSRDVFETKYAEAFGDKGDVSQSDSNINRLNRFYIARYINNMTMRSGPEIMAIRRDRKLEDFVRDIDQSNMVDFPKMFEGNSLLRIKVSPKYADVVITKDSSTSTRYTMTVNSDFKREVKLTHSNIEVFKQLAKYDLDRADLDAELYTLFDVNLTVTPDLIKPLNHIVAIHRLYLAAQRVYDELSVDLPQAAFDLQKVINDLVDLPANKGIKNASYVDDQLKFTYNNKVYTHKAKNFDKSVLGLIDVAGSSYDSLVKADSESVYETVSNLFKKWFKLNLPERNTSSQYTFLTQNKDARNAYIYAVLEDHLLEDGGYHKPVTYNAPSHVSGVLPPHDSGLGWGLLSHTVHFDSLTYNVNANSFYYIIGDQTYSLHSYDTANLVKEYYAALNKAEHMALEDLRSACAFVVKDQKAKRMLAGDVRRSMIATYAAAHLLQRLDFNAALNIGAINNIRPNEYITDIKNLQVNSNQLSFTRGNTTEQVPLDHSSYFKIVGAYIGAAKSAVMRLQQGVTGELSPEAQGFKAIEQLINTNLKPAEAAKLEKLSLDTSAAKTSFEVWTDRANSKVTWSSRGVRYTATDVPKSEIDHILNKGGDVSKTELMTYLTRNVVRLNPQLQKKLRSRPALEAYVDKNLDAARAAYQTLRVQDMTSQLATKYPTTKG